MKKTCKKVMFFRPYDYNKIESSLNEYARKGLLLSKMTQNLMFQFEYGEPKEVKYKVVYISRGSLFDSDISDEQVKFNEYARGRGYEPVTTNGMICIFRTDKDNQNVLENEDIDKLRGIEKSLKNNYLLPLYFLLLPLFFNGFMQLNDLINLRPKEYSGYYISILAFFVCVLAIIFCMHNIIHYKLWYRNAEKSLAKSEGIPKCSNYTEFEVIIVSVMLLICTVLFTVFTIRINFVSTLAIVIPIPIMIFVYVKILSYLKAHKLSRKLIKATYIASAFVISLLYLLGITFLVLYR